MKSKTSGDDLAKKMVGMDYYKSDLYDVASQLPADIRDPLRDADVGVVNEVVDAICNAVGVAKGDSLNDALVGYKVDEYLYQILRGEHGSTLLADGVTPQQDASGNTFRDLFLASSMNPWSSKLGPDQVGPTGNEGTGEVLENRHLEYLNPKYGKIQDAEERMVNEESVLYGPPKAGADTRTADTKAMFDSIGAREQGPARRPMDEWEAMMNVYKMIRAINKRD